MSDDRGPGSLLALPWSFERPVDRRTYLLAGLLFAAIKYVGDATLVWALAGRVWTPWNYLRHIDLIALVGPSALPGPLLPLVAVWALPFIWIGVTLTMRRALDAGVSPWFAFGFFGPYLNYAVMAAFSILPTRARAAETRPDAPARWSRLRAMTAGVSAGLVVGAVMALLGVLWIGTYGAVLFLGTPVAIGAVSAVVLRRHYPAGPGDLLLTSIIAVTFLGGAFVLLAFEGLVCVAMAYPMAIVLGLLGAGVAGLMGPPRGNRSASVMGLLILPLAALAEPGAPTERALHEVRSSIEISAAPLEVWPHVIAFEPLPEPTELVFRLGVAYPTAARIEGEGAGAVRRCIFSTGAFVEPITTWEPGRRLAFDVTASPRPLTELGPWGDIDAPHLDGYLRIRRGEFRLVPLPGGGTRLEGSTWYELDMAPEGYWQLFADHLIHRIHMRVLAHIEALAER